MGTIEDIDYVQFCGGDRPDWETLGLQPGTAESRVTANVGTLRANLCLKIAVLTNSRSSGTL